MMACCQTGDLDKISKFLPIIFELHRYGDFKYFFSQKNFVMLIWTIVNFWFRQSYELYPSETQKKFPNAVSLSSISYEAVPNKQIFDRNYEIIERIVTFTKKSINEIVEMLLEININALEARTAVLSLQSLYILQFLTKFAFMSEIKDRLKVISPFLEYEILNDDFMNNNDIAIKTDLVQASKIAIQRSVYQNFVGYADPGMEFVINYNDEFLNSIDLGIIFKPKSGTGKTHKVGISMLNKNNFVFGDIEERRTLLLSEETKFLAMTYAFDWDMILIEEQWWRGLDEGGKVDGLVALMDGLAKKKEYALHEMK